MVPGAGIEPARCCHRGILSPLRLPISPPGHVYGWAYYFSSTLHLQAVLCTAVYHNATRAFTRMDLQFLSLFYIIKVVLRTAVCHNANLILGWAYFLSCYFYSLDVIHQPVFISTLKSHK